MHPVPMDASGPVEVPSLPAGIKRPIPVLPPPPYMNRTPLIHEDPALFSPVSNSSSSVHDSDVPLDMSKKPRQSSPARPLAPPLLPSYHHQRPVVAMPIPLTVSSSRTPTATPSPPAPGLALAAAAVVPPPPSYHSHHMIHSDVRRAAVAVPASSGRSGLVGDNKRPTPVVKESRKENSSSRTVSSMGECRECPPKKRDDLSRNCS